VAEEGLGVPPTAFRLRKQTACYTENRIRPPDKRVRFPNLLTANHLLGENWEVGKRDMPTELSAYHADIGYRRIGLLTEFCAKGLRQMRRLQFGVRTMFAVTFVAAVVLAHRSWHNRVQRTESQFVQAAGMVHPGYADGRAAQFDDRFDLSFGACGLPSILCSVCLGDDHHVIMLTVDDDMPPKTVAELANLPYLQGLIISGNVRPFERDLPRLRHLRYLCLHGTRATDDTVASISGMNELRHLRLGHTFVSDECIEHLAQLQHLESLGMHGSKISDAGLERLRQALPACHIMDY